MNDNHPGTNGSNMGFMERHERCPHLFEPLDFGFMSLPNRVLIESMHAGLEEERDGMQRLARFHSKRAIMEGMIQSCASA